MSSDSASTREGIIDPRQNLLLAAVPQTVYRELLLRLELVDLPLGWPVYEAGQHLAHVYFSTGSIVSLQYVTEAGSSTEFALIGNDGMIGVSLLMGAATTHGRAVVHSPGHAYRLPASILRYEFERHVPLQHTLMRYTQVLLTQMAQTAVCNRHHSVEQRICRRFLMTWDRLQLNEFRMTHDLCADILGVSRKAVTNAAGILQDAGWIRYRRGKVTLLDRAQIEARSCECYAVVKQESDRLRAL